MKRYYIVITPFFPNHQSFRGPFIYDQVKAIERNSDYKVIVFKPKTIYSQEKDYCYNGINVYLYPDIQMPSYVLNGLTNNINNIMFLKKLNELNIDITNIDVVHAHTARFAAFALALKRKNNKIKTLVQHHDPDPLNIRNGIWASKKWNALFRSRMSSKLFEQIDCHICISKFVADSLKSYPKPTNNTYLDSYKNILNLVKNEPQIKINQLYILYNGVDTTIFYPQKRKDNPIFTIGCIGNFVDWKSQETLIQAIYILKNKHIETRTIFIGSGPTLKSCKDLVNELNLSNYITFKKEVQHHELAMFYNSLDLFILPSYFEGFGCVFTEASACGVPYIICKGQGAAEYIDPNEADYWTFTPRNFHELAEKIENYILKKPQQHLIITYEIDTLIKDFISFINKDN